MQSALGYSSRSSGNALQNLVKRKNLETYISPDIFEKLDSRVEFERPGSGGAQPITYGFEATLLIDLCNAILEAKNADVLNEKELRIAEFAEIIIRSVAKVGIIALVDEATGYQEIRDRLALQKILDKFISKELSKWAKKFPDEFYKEMFRLRDWQYTPLNVRRPSLVGKFTNAIVYDRLAPGVLKELKRITPRDEKGRTRLRFHQRLTPDIGHPKLTEHLSNIIVLMRASANWSNFYRLLQRALPKYGENIPLPFDENEK